MLSQKSASLKTSRESWPWTALTFVLLAVAAWFVPPLRERFLYDRDLITSGEVWRFFTGHLAHHSLSHLGWNLAVFLPAAMWLERLHPLLARVFLLASPVFISALLWFREPDLQLYAGLSGVTMGVLTLLVLVQLLSASAAEPRQFWVVALILIAVRIAIEFRTPASAIFASLPVGIRNVPLAHLGGALCAVIVAAAFRRRLARARS